MRKQILKSTCIFAALFLFSCGKPIPTEDIHTRLSWSSLSTLSFGGGIADGLNGYWASIHVYDYYGITEEILGTSDYFQYRGTCINTDTRSDVTLNCKPGDSVHFSIILSDTVLAYSGHHIVRAKPKFSNYILNKDSVFSVAWNRMKSDSSHIIIAIDAMDSNGRYVGNTYKIKDTNDSVISMNIKSFLRDSLERKATKLKISAMCWIAVPFETEIDRFGQSSIDQKSYTKDSSEINILN